MLNKKEIAKGASFLMLAAGISAGLKFISIPVLARILTPQDFGTAGVALVLVSLVNVLAGNSAMGAAVTYFKNERDRYDDAVALIGASFAVVSSVACWTMSDAIAAFWDVPEAAPLVRIVSLVFPFSIFTGIGFAFLARDLRFGIIAKINVVASILSASTALSFAFLGFGALSLVAQTAIFSISQFTGFFWFGTYRPKGRFQLSAFRTLIPYVYRLTFSDFLIWTSREGPFVLISKNLGIELGGVFRLFSRFTGLPREVIGDNLTRAAFAGMAGGTRDQTHDGFLWSSKVVIYVLGAALCWLAALSEPLTRIVLGPQYAEYWHVTLFLSVGLLIQTSANMAIPFLKARGESKVVLVASFARAVFILVGTFVFLWLLGTVEGAVIGTMIGMLTFATLIVAIILPRQNVSLQDLISVIFIPLALVSATGVLVFCFSQYFSEDISVVVNVLLGSLGGAICYVGLIRVCAKQDFHLIIRVFSERLKRSKK